MKVILRKKLYTGKVGKASMRCRAGEVEMKKRLLGLALVLGLLLVDQASKLCAVHFLQGKPSQPIIPGVFELKYIQNTGSAFGLFAQSGHLVVVLTLLLAAFLVFLYFKMPLTREYRMYRVFMLVLVAGGLGNIIDRFTRGFVVDFFYFSLIDFPVFNVADCYITVTAVCLFVYCLRDKEGRLERLFIKKADKM